MCFFAGLLAFFFNCKHDSELAAGPGAHVADGQHAPAGPHQDRGAQHLLLLRALPLAQQQEPAAQLQSAHHGPCQGTRHGTFSAA